MCIPKAGLPSARKDRNSVLVDGVAVGVSNWGLSNSNELREIARAFPLPSMDRHHGYCRRKLGRKDLCDF